MSRLDTTAVYGGSFDPITKGHIDVILKAAQTFDHVIVGIGSNPKKTRCISVTRSMVLIEDSLNEFLEDHPLKDLRDKISVESFVGEGLVSFARRKEATHLVRGLRQASDFNDEFSLRGVVEQIAPDLVMAHFIGEAKYLHVSSSTARELASLGESIGWLVTPCVSAELKGLLDPRFRDQD